MTNTASKFITLFALIVLALSFQSCEKEEMLMSPTKEYIGVDAELWVYFQRFEEEAAARGVYVNLNEKGITGVIEDINHEHVVGMCNHNVDTPNHVVLDKDFWTRSSSLKKELIVFHELGHCYFGMGHRDEAHEDGRCKSIMRSGMGGCMDIYTENYRNDYLNEFFVEQ